VEAWLAGKTDGTTGHELRHVYSLDGTVWVPEDRTTIALAKGAAAQWDDFDLQAPAIVRDGTTDYLFYCGSNSDFKHELGIATAAVASPQNGPWTKGSNPKLSPTGAENSLRDVAVVKDLAETDANKRWKILFGVGDATDKWSIHLATAPDPPNTSTWTRQGEVIARGGTGAKDETWARAPFVARHGGVWYVFYLGRDTNSECHLLCAIGTDLASLTKVGPGTSYWDKSGSGASNLTANLTGRTLTIGDTTGFAVDDPIWIDNDSSGNAAASRVRKVVSSTQLELYHGMDGFTTTTPAKARSTSSSPNFGGGVVVKVINAGWRLYWTFWEPFENDTGIDDPLIEEMCILTHSAKAPNAIFALEGLLSPTPVRGSWSNERSYENMGILLVPVPTELLNARGRLPNILRPRLFQPGIAR
jgi:hypothetical protein